VLCERYVDKILTDNKKQLEEPVIRLKDVKEKISKWNESLVMFPS